MRGKSPTGEKRVHNEKKMGVATNFEQWFPKKTREEGAQEPKRRKILEAVKKPIQGRKLTQNGPPEGG